jgi:hypothetical protein
LKAFRAVRTFRKSPRCRKRREIGQIGGGTQSQGDRGPIGRTPASKIRHRSVEIIESRGSYCDLKFGMNGSQFSCLCRCKKSQQRMIVGIDTVVTG